MDAYDEDPNAPDGGAPAGEAAAGGPSGAHDPLGAGGPPSAGERPGDGEQSGAPPRPGDGDPPGAGDPPGQSGHSVEPGHGGHSVAPDPDDHPVAPVPDGRPVASDPDGHPVAPGSGGHSVVPDPDGHPVVPGPRAEARGGVAALSTPYRVGAALALAVVAVTACVHLGMVFLHVAPSNTMTKQHGKAVDDWVYPEFEQNWKLFAPNPLQQNIAVQVRAEVATGAGGLRTTGWYDLSAQDGRAIDGNPVPSHTEQNELRRAWDFYGASHTNENRPAGLRGMLAEQYLRRIVVLRLGRDHAAGPDGVIQRVQVRSRTTNVQPPVWSGEKVPDAPAYRVLPWWTVPSGELEGGVR
ncbi:DUF5819 family protein [Streptomyces sp. NPDC086766]|uniref:DUF5819 family protein n=1 Tax=Streptomyces sp. NPDC086766 TaxID=3365754 RepID=UPI00380139EE